MNHCTSTPLQFSPKGISLDNQSPPMHIFCKIRSGSRIRKWGRKLYSLWISFIYFKCRSLPSPRPLRHARFQQMSEEWALGDSDSFCCGSQGDLRTRTYPDRPLSPTGKEHSGLHVHQEASALSLCRLHQPSRNQWIKIIYQSHHTWKLSCLRQPILIYWKGMDGTEGLLRSPPDGFCFSGVQLLYNVAFCSAYSKANQPCTHMDRLFFWFPFPFRSPEHWVELPMLL